MGLVCGYFGGIVCSKVGGAYRKLLHGDEQVLYLVESAFCGLDLVDCIVGIAGSLVKPNKLRLHILGSNEAGRIVGGAVDLKAGGQSLNVGSKCVAVGV